MSNSLAGGHAGEWPHRHDPRDQLRLSYAFQPPDPDRIARAYPPRDRCAWSPEIVRRHARVMEIDNQIFAAVTEEDADIPLYCAGPRDRICPTCYRFYYKNRSEARKA